MNLSYSTAILQDRAWRLWAAEQLVLTAWLPVVANRSVFIFPSTDNMRRILGRMRLFAPDSPIFLLSSSSSPSVKMKVCGNREQAGRYRQSGSPP